MFCPQCGSSNDTTAKFCLGCGTALPQIGQHTSVPQTAIAPEEFYQAIVGPKNQDYYLRHFSRFERNGKVDASWHWPAFFVTFYWLLYRKMRLYASLYFFLPYLGAIPLGIIGSVVGNSANTVIGLAYTLYLIGIFLLPPLYANALYYSHCKKKISAAKASPYGAQRQLGELSGKGGTSGMALVILLLVGGGFIAILAAIAIPAYDDFTTRARLSEAMIFGTGATESVAGYYSQHQQFPDSLEMAGFTERLPASVKKIGVDNQTGNVDITIASPPVNGKVLTFTPAIDANNQITWKCTSQEIPYKYLPHSCRQQK